LQSLSLLFAFFEDLSRTIMAFPALMFVRRYAAESLRNFTPLFDRVLVEKFTPETKTKGGIMIPEKAQGKVLEGTVIAAGPGGRNDDGKTVPITVKVGDRVLLPEYGGTKITIDEKEFYVYREHDILGRWDK